MPRGQSRSGILRSARLMFRTLGRLALTFIQYLGELALLAAETVQAIFIAPIRWRLFLRQMVEMGFRSQLVVIVTGGFTGAVFAAQTYFQFHRIGMESAVGAVVSVSMFRELGPVLTGLMVAGRVGAAIAAEIGTMKVTEQIDALRALGVHPIDYLVVPRVLAMHDFDAAAGRGMRRALAICVRLPCRHQVLGHLGSVLHASDGHLHRHARHQDGAHERVLLSRSSSSS